jgi:LPS sulfotransferase NodH
MQNATQPLANDTSAPSGARSAAPVFVVGCPRSGTTYLYHILLSAGNFAVYRAESEVFHVLEPRFGDLSHRENKKRLLAAWFKSRLFSATGLEAEPLRQKIMQECRNGGDFLRIVMEETARHQGVGRWADCTPDHVLYLHRIKQTIPTALVIHIIRDGRDVALSMEKQGWPQQLSWDRRPRRMAGGVYWEWMTRRGCAEGEKLGLDYIEVRYEDLVSKPREVLVRLSAFIGQQLDYDEILKVGIGSVSRPNTSFKDEAGFTPVERWKKFYSTEEIAEFEGLAGESLKRLGYERLVECETASVGLRLFRAQYLAFFGGKDFLRTKTPLGPRLISGDLSKM